MGLINSLKILTHFNTSISDRVAICRRFEKRYSMSEMTIKLNNSIDSNKISREFADGLQVIHYLSILNLIDICSFKEEYDNGLQKNIKESAQNSRLLLLRKSCSEDFKKIKCQDLQILRNSMLVHPLRDVKGNYSENLIKELDNIPRNLNDVYEYCEIISNVYSRIKKELIQ